jgi:hypothetical protein
MSKKLPQAIGQTIDDLRRTKPDLRDETKGARVSLASVPSPVPSGRTGDVLAEEARKRRRNASKAPPNKLNEPNSISPKPLPPVVPAAAEPARKPEKPTRKPD